MENRRGFGEGFTPKSLSFEIMFWPSHDHLLGEVVMATGLYYSILEPCLEWMGSRESTQSTMNLRCTSPDAENFYGAIDLHCLQTTGAFKAKLEGLSALSTTFWLSEEAPRCRNQSCVRLWLIQFQSYPTYLLPLIPPFQSWESNSMETHQHQREAWRALRISLNEHDWPIDPSGVSFS